MCEMFREFRKFNSDLSRWNVANVTDMSIICSRYSLFSMIYQVGIKDGIVDGCDSFNPNLRPIGCSSYFRRGAER